MASRDELQLRPGEVKEIASEQAVLQNDTWTSDAFDISLLKENLMGLQFIMTDAGATTGRGKIEVLLSLNGEDYVDALADVKTGITAADGQTIEQVVMDDIPALSFKVKVTETSNTEAIAMSIDASGK